MEACTASLPPEAAELDVQQEAAVVVAAEPGAQQEAAAAVDLQVVAAAMQWGVRPLMVSSVEFAATAVGQQRAASCSPMATMARQILAAAVRFWFRARSSLARAPR